MHQRQVGVYPLNLALSSCNWRNMRHVRDRHARDQALPLVVRRLNHAVLSAHVVALGPDLNLFEDSDHGQQTSQSQSAQVVNSAGIRSGEALGPP